MQAPDPTPACRLDSPCCQQVVAAVLALLAADIHFVPAVMRLESPARGHLTHVTPSLPGAHFTHLC
jgi:hypothetical protein